MEKSLFVENSKAEVLLMYTHKGGDCIAIIKRDGYCNDIVAENKMIQDFTKVFYEYIDNIKKDTCKGKMRGKCSLNYVVHGNRVEYYTKDQFLLAYIKLAIGGNFQANGKYIHDVGMVLEQYVKSLYSGTCFRI